VTGASRIAPSEVHEVTITDVFFFLPQLGGGGAEMNAVRLASGFMKHGVRPVYVVTRGPGSYAEHLPKDVEVIVLDTGRIKSSTLRLVRSIAPLARLIAARRPDIVVPVLSVSALAALAAVQWSQHKPKVVLSIQNTLEPPKSGVPNLYGRAEAVLIRRMFPQADRVVALSHGVAGDVARAVPALRNQIDVVHNVGLPLASQTAAPEPDMPVRSKQRIRFLACGRLVEQKGYPFLFEAFARVVREKDTELHILGEGPLRSSLDALAQRLGIADRVTYLGFRRNPFVHMQAADVFVLSSLWEGFGNVIVESMAMGTPVISTDCPHGPDEIITDGVNGLLVPPGDAAALARAMLLLADDAGLRGRLAQAGQIRAQDFSAEGIAGEFAAVLRKLVFSDPRAGQPVFDVLPMATDHSETR